MTPIFDIEWRTAVAVSARCGEEGWRAARRLSLLLPLLPWMLLRAGSAWWLGGFPTPPRDRAALLWDLVGGPAATHFPETAAMLPRLVAWLDPCLELVAGVFGVMWVCALLPEVYRGQGPSLRAARARLSRRMGAAWVASFPGIVGSGALIVLADALGNLPVGGSAAHWIVMGLALLCRAFFIYAIAAVIISGTSPATAWRRSADLAGRYLVPTLGVVALSFLVVWPWRTSPLLSLSLFDRFAPEWVGAWVAFGALPLVGVTLFVTAVTTRLYLHRYGAERAR